MPVSADFLEAIWSPQDEGYAEIRMIQGRKVNQRFFKYPEGWEYLLDLVENANQMDGLNVYMGVLLRQRPSGKAADVVQNTRVLWADFDMKAFDGSRINTFHAISRINVPPAIIIDSGNGFHCYWLLDEPVDVRVAQNLMSGISKRYGADHVGDPARILRIPGTYNWKDHAKSKLVRIVRFNPYDVTRTADMYDEGTGYTSLFAPRPGRGVRTRVITDESLGDRLSAGPPSGKRSEYLFGIVCDMVREGNPPAEVIYTTLMESPAGGKMREMGSQEAWRWLLRTYRAAYAAVDSEE